MYNLDKAKRVLNHRGWYSLAIRIDLPEFRAEKFKADWTEESFREYLELHCGKEETETIIHEITL